MSQPSRQDARAAALRKLMQDRQPAPPTVAAGEPAEAYAAQHFAEIDPARFTHLTAFLNASHDEPSQDSAPPDRLAQRLLLEEYANGIRRLRTIASVTDLMLDRAATTIRDGQRVIRTHTRRQATPQ